MIFMPLSSRQVLSMSLLAVLATAIMFHWTHRKPFLMKAKWYFNILLITIAIVIIAYFFKPSYNREQFEQNVDDSRYLRFGDAISLFTLKNTFLKQNDSNPALTQTASLTRPEDVSTGSYKQLFIIEDSGQPAGPGNSNPVMTNSIICLVASNGQYVAAADNGNVVLQDNRCDGRCSFTIEGEDVATTKIQFGDTIYLKNLVNSASGLYITCNDDSNVVIGPKSSNSHLSVQDKYGQGINVNWARSAKAMQSSTYQNYAPYFAIDGKSTSFSHTNSEIKPWWEIQLPNQIYLDRIIIKNRLNGGDAVSMRLSNFSIVIKDALGTQMANKDFKTDTPTSEFSWNNIYRVGRLVRIQLKDTAPQYLHMSEVQVFGMPITYSISLSKPMMVDLTTFASHEIISTNASLAPSFENQDLPVTKQDMSIAFFINIDSKMYFSAPTSYTNLMLKGIGGASDSQSTRSPGIWLTPQSPNLKVSVSTGQKISESIEKSSISLRTGQPVHVAVIVDSGVAIKTGWKVGNFKSIATSNVMFVIFHPIQKRYYTLTGIDSTNYTSTFGKVSMLALDDLDAAGFQNLGLYNTSIALPSISLYIDGRLSDIKQLSSLPIYNEMPLLLNANNSLSAIFTEIKFTNYALTPHQVRSMAVLKISKICKTLVSITRDASKIATFSHTELPSYNQALTLTFWSKISKQSSSKKIPLILKGTIDDPEFGVLLSQNGLSVSVPIRTLSRPVTEGIDQPNFVFKNDVWMHFALVLKEGKVTFYVNGNDVATSALNKQFDPNFSDVNVGGFAGSLQNCRICNYAISENELPMLMGKHPDFAANNLLKTAFTKAGCNAYPYAIDQDPGAAADLKTLLANGRSDLVDAALSSIKKSADAYLSGSDTSVQAKAYSTMCYGDISNMNMANLKATLKDQDCDASDDCSQDEASDYYDYVKNADCGSQKFVKISSLTDPDSLSAFLCANPDVAKAIAADVNAKKPAMPSDAASITATLRADPSAAAQVIAGLIQNTDDKNLVKTIAASFLRSGNLNIAELIKHIPPCKLSTILQGSGVQLLNGKPLKPNTNNIVALMKDNATMQKVISSLVSSGQLTPKMLLDQISDSSELRDLISNSCASQPIENNNDFTKYIKKADLPCFGCSFD